MGIRIEADKMERGTVALPVATTTEWCSGVQIWHQGSLTGIRIESDKMEGGTVALSMATRTRRINMATTISVRQQRATRGTLNSALVRDRTYAEMGVKKFRASVLHGSIGDIIGTKSHEGSGGNRLHTCRPGRFVTAGMQCVLRILTH